MKILQDIKQFLHWREKQKRRVKNYSPLLSLEMGAYTYEECLLAASRSRIIPHEDVGIVAQYMYCRCNRGKRTIGYALYLIERASME
jgi:hypothetical protein